MKKRKLNDGNEMPVIGMGAYLVPDGEECVEMLKTGLSLGYRMIDTSAAYENERSVGRAVRESGIPREEIFITTKLWVQDYGYQNAQAAIKRCLNRLDIEYFDLLLLHRPAGDNVGAYRALEDAKWKGLVKSIGVCNHTSEQLRWLVEETAVMPAVDQMECHPLQQQRALLPYLDERNILLESWFPLGHGSKRLNLNEQIIRLSQKYGKSVSQILLRWHVQEGFAVIPKSTNPEHMKENLDIFNFSLADEDMETIRRMDADRYLGGDPEAKENFAKWESARFRT